MTDNDTVLRLSEVRRRTGMSRSAIYGEISAGAFPKQVPISKRAVGWLESEIRDWLRARVLERDATL